MPDIPLPGEQLLALVKCYTGSPRTIFSAHVERIYEMRKAANSKRWRREFGGKSAPSSTDTSLFHGAGLFSWGRPYRFKECLKRNADGNPGAAGIPAVVQVISVIAVHNVNVVGLVPVVSPEFRIRINDTEQKTPVLKARKPPNLHKGEAVDAERVT